MNPILVLSCGDAQWQTKLDLYLSKGFDVDLSQFDVRDTEFCQGIAAQYDRVFQVEAANKMAWFRDSN